MSWIGPAISAGASLLGGAMSGSSAGSAAQSAADAQVRAAQIAADAARFRPVGITTNFGTSNFGFDSSGNLTSAGYQLSPELQAYQNEIMGLNRQNLADVANVQALGRGYLAQTPEQVAANWMQQQQGLLQPSRNLQRAQIQQGLFNSGRGGLAVAQGGNLAAANPEMQAYYNALAQQDAQLAAQAQQAGQQQTTYGLGLLSSAYAPFQTGLGLSSNIEDLGANALTIGSQLGARTSASGANVGNALMAGAKAAAPYQLAAGSYNPVGSFLSNFGSNTKATNALGNWLGSGNIFGISPTSAVTNQIAQLGGTMSDFYSGNNGWGSWGE